MELRPAVTPSPAAATAGHHNTHDTVMRLNVTTIILFWFFSIAGAVPAGGLSAENCNIGVRRGSWVQCTRPTPRPAPRPPPRPASPSLGGRAGAAVRPAAAGQRECSGRAGSSAPVQSLQPRPANCEYAYKSGCC